MGVGGSNTRVFFFFLGYNIWQYWDSNQVFSTERTKYDSLCLIQISCKPVRCTGKLLNIRSKLILIHFASFVEYAFFFFFFAVRNIVGKIDKRDFMDLI
jgi:hypothetical protein